MPKLACICGYVHDLSPIPDDGYRTIRDRDFETWIEDLKAADAGDGGARARVTNYYRLLYECPECGRIAWSKPDSRGSTFTFYKPER